MTLKEWKENITGYEITEDLVHCVLRDWEEERLEAKRVIKLFFNSIAVGSENYVGGIEKLEFENLYEKLNG